MNPGDADTSAFPSGKGSSDGPPHTDPPPRRHFVKSDIPDDVRDEMDRRTGKGEEEAVREERPKEKVRPTARKKVKGSGEGKEHGTRPGRRTADRRSLLAMDVIAFVLLVAVSSYMLAGALTVEDEPGGPEDEGVVVEHASTSLTAFLASEVDEASYTDLDGVETVYRGRTAGALIVEDVLLRGAGALDEDGLAGGVEFELYRLLLDTVGDGYEFLLTVSAGGGVVFELGELESPAEAHGSSSVPLSIDDMVIAVELSLKEVAGR